MRYLVNGIYLNAEASGMWAASPLVLLHGFTGSSKSWEPFLSDWEQHLPVLRVDIIGHGLSDKPEEASRYSIEQAADDLASLFDQMKINQVNLLGYSMGGRLALTFAVKYPERLSSLILESSSPGLATAEERRERVEKDCQLAKRIEREGIPAFVDYWEQIPLFSTQSSLPAEVKQRIRAERLQNEAKGLAGSLKGMGTGAQPSWWESLDDLQVPVLLLAGELDEKFCSIAKRMHALLPKSDLKIVQNAGHTVHVEQPHIFGKMVMDFLDKLSTKAKEANYLAVEWVRQGEYEDIIYETYNGIAKITINRPHVRNAFRPKTVSEMFDAFCEARDDSDIGVVILTGAGTEAFCSGGDQSVRGHGGYVGEDKIPRLNVLDLQRLIRIIPKPVIAMVAGYAIGGGHVLHVVCDLTIAADNARFGQTGPKVGSFDAGYGAGYLARIVGHKKAREIWYLCRQYNAEEALQMGLVNTVVPLDQLEAETIKWCEEILEKSPTAIRFLKASFNADTDGLAGLQQLGGDATLLYYTTDEAKEGRDAFKEKRKPDFKQFPRFP